MNIKFKKLNKTIVNCKKCPRLTNFIKKISLEKRKQNINEKYWGKPVTGFGDLSAKLMIIGLAPAAHGGTRTGRAFTGDKSGDFLFKSLYSVKLSNQDYSKKELHQIGLLSTKPKLYVCNVDEKSISEGNKYTNSFINKFGAIQDLYFNKKRTDELSVKRDSFDTSTISSSTSG